MTERNLAYYAAMSTSQLTTITLDVGSTLLHCEPPPSVLYADALSRRGTKVTPEQVAPVFSQEWRDMQQLTLPGKDRYSSIAGGERAWWGQFLRNVLARLEHDGPWELLLDDLYEAFSQPGVWKVYPEVRQTLEQLRSQGYTLAIISNWDSRLGELLHHLELEEYFATITVSSIEGVEKPLPEIFMRTLSRLGVQAAESAHVGDSLREDYGGATAAGLLPILLDRAGEFSALEYRRISSLDGLFAII